MSAAHTPAALLVAAQALSLVDQIELVQQILYGPAFADLYTGPLDHALEALVEEANSPDPDGALWASVDRAYADRVAA